jgi:hypothetical protein
MFKFKNLFNYNVKIYFLFIFLIDTTDNLYLYEKRELLKLFSKNFSLFTLFFRELHEQMKMMNNFEIYFVFINIVLLSAVFSEEIEVTTILEPG